MDAPQALSPESWPPCRRRSSLCFDGRAEQIRVLTARVAELEAKLGKDSTNSSLPPSTDAPARQAAARPTPQARRPPGGQPGHAKHERALLPVEQCQDVVPCVPPACRRCGQPLTGTDPEPLRHQVWELPEIQPIVTEYQRHRLVCRCGCSTCGDLARRRPHRPGRAAPDRLQRSAHGLLPPVQTPGRPVLEYDSPPTRQFRLDGGLAEPRRRGRAARLRRTGPATARPARSAHRRVADQGRPGQGLGLDLRRCEPSPSSPAAPVGPPK